MRSVKEKEMTECKCFVVVIVLYSLCFGPGLLYIASNAYTSLLCMHNSRAALLLLTKVLCGQFADRIDTSPQIESRLRESIRPRYL